MVKLNELTISETLDGLKNKEFTATEVAGAYIDKMQDDKKYNAYVTQTPELALEQAKIADERYAKGQNRLLEGIPMGIKELFCTKDVRTTACSKILENFVPPYESTVTQNLLNEGVCVLGKLNMDEFAMGGSNEKSAFGPVINPWSKDVPLVPGGSSGGSAAAVAANMCAAATGTDTGGSIRQPAAFCGIVGLKPTYGRCSRYGIIAFASSFDQAGPMTKSVQDSALLLNVMAGYDPKDATSANVAKPDFAALLNADVKGLKIGIPQEYKSDNMNEDVLKIWQKTAEMLKDRGAEIVDISLPHTKYALPAYYIIAPAEASSNLARYDGLKYGIRVDGKNVDEMYINSRSKGFGAEVKRRIMVGTYVLSSGYYDAYYMKALKVRRLIKQDFTKAFEKVDLILTPTSPTTAFAIGDENMAKNPVNMWLNDIFTVSVNLAGLPAISVPAGLSDGLPLGVQLIAKPFDEQTMLNAAFALEKDIKFRG